MMIFSDKADVNNHSSNKPQNEISIIMFNKITFTESGKSIYDNLKLEIDETK